MPSRDGVALNQLVLNICNMDLQITSFISDWNEKFPGVDTPELDFDGVEDIEERLATCKNAIKNLEETLKQEKFYLIFLQVNVLWKFVKNCCFNLVLLLFFIFSLQVYFALFSS